MDSQTGDARTLVIRDSASTGEPILGPSVTPYCTVRLTSAELFTWEVGAGVVVVVEPAPPPPHPILNTITDIRTSPRQLVIQMPCIDNFLLKSISGSRSTGSRIDAADVLVTVSVKTTVT